MSDMVELGGKMVEIDEDGFIQDPDVWDEAVATVLGQDRGRGRADGDALEARELSPGLLPGIQHGSHDPEAL